MDKLRRTGTGHYNLGRRQNVTAPIASPILPRHRSFSSQVEKKALKPPRRPPVPPLKPPTPTRRSSLAAQDDVLAMIAANTGKEHLQEFKNQEEQYRKRQNEGDKIDTPRSNAVKAMNQSLERIQDRLQGLTRDIQAVRSNTLREVEEIYAKFRSKVHNLNRRVQERSIRIDDLPNEIQSKRKEATKKGRLDYLLEQHFEITGLGPLRRRLDLVADQVGESRRELADLKYTIDWTAWDLERTRFQLGEVMEATSDLKGEGGMHHESNHSFERLARAFHHIYELLSELRMNLMLTRGSLPPSQAQRYVRMSTSLAMAFYVAAWSAESDGHIWRKIDRYASWASRFPELNDHVSLEIVPLLLMAELSTHGRASFQLLVMTKLAKSSSPTVKATYQSMIDINYRYSEILREFREDSLSFWREGLSLLNPALRSNLGRLKYAALSPFSRYSRAALDSEVACRNTVEEMKHSVGDIKKLFVQSEWRQIFIERLERTRESAELAEEQFKKFTRPFLHDYDKFSCLITTRVLNNDAHDYNLERLLLEENERAKTQYNEKKAKNEALRAAELNNARVFEQLSSPALYRDHMVANRLMDPIKLRGKDTLYHCKDKYPIEFISLESRIIHVLKELSPGTIVGLDMLSGHQDRKEFPRFISIATTEKVFLIDWDWNFRELIPSLTKFLENPGIVKIVHDVGIMTSHLSDRDIHPRGTVSIDKQVSSTALKPSDRLTSAGLWQPPIAGSKLLGSLSKFFTDLAFLSTYNLWTFLSAITPEQVSLLSPDLKASILKARERLHHKIAAADDSGLEFGPVKWDHDGIFWKLKKALDINPLGPSRFVDSLKLLTRTDADKRMWSTAGHGLDTNGFDRDDLAAYYMFTTYNEELPAISALFTRKKGNAAGRILRVAQRLDLTLHSEDLKTLQDASGKTQLAKEKLSRRGVMSDIEAKDHRSRRREILKRRAEKKLEHTQTEPSRSHSGTGTVGTVSDKSQDSTPNTPKKTSETMKTSSEATAQSTFDRKTNEKKKVKVASEPKRQTANKSSVGPTRNVLLSKRAPKERLVPPRLKSRLVNTMPKLDRVQVRQPSIPPKHKASGGKLAQPTPSSRSLPRKVYSNMNQNANQAETATSTTLKDMVPFRDHKEKSEKSPTQAKDAEASDTKIASSQVGSARNSTNDKVKATSPQFPIRNFYLNLMRRVRSSENKEKSG